MNYKIGDTSPSPTNITGNHSIDIVMRSSCPNQLSPKQFLKVCDRKIYQQLFEFVNQRGQLQL